jgi:hypothetical protein
MAAEYYHSACLPSGAWNLVLVYNIFELSSKLSLEEPRDQTHIPAFISLGEDADPIARPLSGRRMSRIARISQKMIF